MCCVNDRASDNQSQYAKLRCHSIRNAEIDGCTTLLREAGRKPSIALGLAA